MEQRLIEEMLKNRDKARHFCGKPPESAEYAASEYFPGYEKLYYKDREGNWYFKTIDRKNEH